MHAATILGFLLLLIGLWGMLTQKNIIKMIIGFSIMDTGLHVVMVSLGYIGGRTAPIINGAVDRTIAASQVVDPIPQALVLTAIVIGLAVTALLLAYAVRLHARKKTLLVDDFEEQQW